MWNPNDWKNIKSLKERFEFLVVFDQSFEFCLKKTNFYSIDLINNAALLEKNEFLKYNDELNVLNDLDFFVKSCF